MKDLYGIYDPASEDRCTASANLRGEHFQCELHQEHQGWSHSNGVAELLWTCDHPANNAPEEAP